MASSETKNGPFGCQFVTDFDTDAKEITNDLGIGAAWVNLFGDLADNTGMHGLPNIKRHRNWGKKIFWLLILMTSFGK